MAKAQVSMKAFIEAHQGAKNLAEAAEATGLTPNSHQARASKYRSDYSIPLKKFSRGGGARLDIDEAVMLLAELEGVEVEVIEARQVALREAKAKRDANKAAKAAETAE